jgi:NAD(P)-dependent dehydrogenase (short-subunit alcohol dehydrogenase family)
MTETAKTAIVTGAGSGIGLATVRMLGQLGYRIMLVGRDPAKLARAAEGLTDPVIFPADLSQSAEAQRMIDEGSRLLGRIDVLVNNAGWTPLKPIGLHLAEDIEQVFRINAIGPCVAIARLFPLLVKHGGGCIVNVSSMATVDPFAGLYAYAAAKASLNVMVKSCVNEGKKRGVRAFAVAPGAVETQLLRSMFPETAVPKSRALAPERVAEVIVDCIEGKREADLGGTILVPSP